MPSSASFSGLRVRLHNQIFGLSLCLASALSVFTGTASTAEIPARLEVEAPERANPSISVTLTVRARDGAGRLLETYEGQGLVFGAAPVGSPDADRMTIRFRSGVAVVRRALVVSDVIRAEAGGAEGICEVELLRVPGFLSLLPPLLAIALALLTRHVVLSLFCGVWLGATFLAGMNPLLGFLRSLDKYVKAALGDPDHAAIVIFSLCLGGMVGIVARSGGLHAIAAGMARWASTPRRGQIGTWLMGLAIFFDDYANTLLVGNTMRPFTDRLRVSREKLAFIVDATAAPIASVAAVSTWVGYEIGLIQDSWSSLGLQGSENIYTVFLRTIPYRFYALILLFTVLVVAVTGRDLGAMRKAELRARMQGKLTRDGAVPLSGRELTEMSPPEGVPLRWINAAGPILVVIVAVVVGLYYSGAKALGAAYSGSGLMEVLGAADSLNVLLWAAAAGSAAAGILTLGQKILNASQMMDAWLSGVKAMMLAMVVLVSAWSLGAVCSDLYTAGYIVDRVSGVITLSVLPAAVFLTAAAISFATGTSWGTMAILMPVVIPLGYHLSPSSEVPMGPMLATVAAVLSGSCFGDHASPISDTTILSSMASSCDHVDHVKTQLPYALLAGVIGICAGYLPAGFGVHPALSLASGLAAMVIFVVLVGKKVPAG